MGLFHRTTNWHRREKERKNKMSETLKKLFGFDHTKKESQKGKGKKAPSTRELIEQRADEDILPPKKIDSLAEAETIMHKEEHLSDDDHLSKLSESPDEKKFDE